MQPPSQKLHQIIAGTAKFVSEHGGQSEIILKVKQGNNPMFGFLNSDHHLHEYYKYILNNRHLLEGTGKERLGLAEDASTFAEGLSLLGSTYGTVDEDDDAECKPELGMLSPKDAGLLTAEAALGASKSSHQIMERPKPSETCKTKGKTLLSSVDMEKHLKNGTKMVMNLKNEKAVVSSMNGHVASPSREQSRSGSSEPKSTSKILPEIRKKFSVDKKDFIKPNIASAASGALLVKADLKALTDRSSQSSKTEEYGMSADAAAAVVMAATRGFGRGKQTTTNHRSSSSGLAESTGTGKPGGVGQVDVHSANAAAQAAVHEGDLADAHLTAAEKLKAERLRKAKIFTAMIRNGGNVSDSTREPAMQLLGAATLTGAAGNGNHMATNIDASVVNLLKDNGKSTRDEHQKELYPVAVEVHDAGNIMKCSTEEVKEKGKKSYSAELLRRDSKKHKSSHETERSHHKSSRLHSDKRRSVSKEHSRSKNSSTDKSRFCNSRKRSHRDQDAGKREKHGHVKQHTSDSSDLDGEKQKRHRHRPRPSSPDTADEKQRRVKHRHRSFSPDREGDEKPKGRRHRRSRSSSSDTEDGKSKHRRSHRRHPSSSPDKEVEKSKHRKHKHHRSSSPDTEVEKLKHRKHKHHRSSSHDTEDEKPKKGRSSRHRSSSSREVERFPNDEQPGFSPDMKKSPVYQSQSFDGSKVAEKIADARPVDDFSQGLSAQDVPGDIRAKVRAMLLSNLL